MIALSSEFWAAIVGAFLGAVVGGLITYVIQLDSQAKADALRRQAQLDNQKALGHAIIYKLIAIHSHLKTFTQHFEHAFEGVAAENLKAEPWQFVLAVAANPNHINFTTDEMTLLVSLKEEELFNVMITLDAAHNMMVDLFNLMGKKREELIGMLPPDAVVGQVGSSLLDNRRFLAARPRMVELNMLIRDMRNYAAKDAALSEETLFLAHAAFKKKLQLNFNIGLVKDRA